MFGRNYEFYTDEIFWRVLVKRYYKTMKDIEDGNRCNKIGRITEVLKYVTPSLPDLGREYRISFVIAFAKYLHEALLELNELLLPPGQLQQLKNAFKIGISEGLNVCILDPSPIQTQQDTAINICKAFLDFVK
jgi:hypothetical protein